MKCKVCNKRIKAPDITKCKIIKIFCSKGCREQWHNYSRKDREYKNQWMLFFMPPDNKLHASAREVILNSTKSKDVRK